MVASYQFQTLRSQTNNNRDLLAQALERQVADVVPAHRRAMTEAEESLFGIDKLNVARSDIPAVTHVDYSARIQTVHRETNPRYHALLSAFAPSSR